MKKGSLLRPRCLAWRCNTAGFQADTLEGERQTRKQWRYGHARIKETTLLSQDVGADIGQERNQLGFLMNLVFYLKKNYPQTDVGALFESRLKYRQTDHPGSAQVVPSSAVCWQHMSTLCMMRRQNSRTWYHQSQREILARNALSGKD
ncbi:MAG: hypothetical protein CSA33_08240 [Desulfobulbus propionicus]|nr:MAG: hypothetical protein CSA33_08240 [Desulfobulbus propionicus]